MKPFPCFWIRILVYGSSSFITLWHFNLEWILVIYLKNNYIFKFYIFP
jgi:hypothetical protein